jgi:hypothetical protein
VNRDAGGDSFKGRLLILAVVGVGTVVMALVTHWLSRL